ncbi:MAG: Ig-like domain-containing protein [Clostridia bacterium]|nr:Ig-like domain-containing protein [Clostridia bacterium]
MKKRFVLILTLILCCLALPALADNVCKFDRSVTTLFEGDTLQTKLILEGEPATGTVTYTSGAPHNGVVDENGLVTGVSKGYTTITATVKTEKRTFKATIQLNVLRKVQSVNVKEDKLNLLPSTDPLIAPLLSSTAQPAPGDGLITPAAPAEEKILVLRLGSNQSVQASCLPNDANNRQFTLSSSDTSIVRVNSNNLQPKGAGECVITVASKQNPEVFVTYRTLVVQPVTRVQLSAPAKSTFVGKTLQLTATYSPENASIKSANWTSSNTKVATVDQNGVVTGISKGTASIKATAKDGSGRNASFSVTVQQQPESITLKENDVVINMGSYKTLQATVLPKNTNNKKVVWSSSDESVAKVNSSGRVTPVGVGSCTITCQSADFPEVSASATVNIHQLVTKIQFAEKEVSFDVHTSLQVFWEVSPQNATNPGVTFSSNKESIATVDANGLITGHKRGECYITAKAVDGSGRNARIKVKVLQPVEGVHMKNDTLNVGVDESITATAVLEPSDASNTNMTWVSADTTIATVKGTKLRPSITGRRWGTTTITGTTEDGGYTTSATVKVGNYDKAVKITDLYLSDNKIKIVVKNESNMNITRFYYTIYCYDWQDEPIVCHENGGTSFDGSYRYTLYEGDSTTHGRFHFGDFVQPETSIARVTMQITGYSTDEGYFRDINENRQTVFEYKTSEFVGKPAPTEVLLVAPAQ